MKRIISRIFFCAAVLAGAAACEEAGNVETEKPAPRLISIVPGTGYVGCTAIISGEYFSEVPEENVVTVDGVTVPVTAATRNRLTLTMPEHELGDVLVGLTVNGKEASTTLKFTYAELPELVMTVSGINPEKGYAGDEVVISGENFSLKSSDNKVTFDGVVAQIVKVTQNTIKVIAPEHARGKVEVKVEVDGKTSSTWFTYVELMIESNTPVSGAEGVEVTITGEGFSEKPAENTVTVNGVPAAVKSASATELVVVMPDNPEGTYPFEIKVGDRTASGGTFTYQGCWRIETVMGVPAGVSANVEGNGTGARLWYGQDLALKKDGTFLMSFRQRDHGVFSMSQDYTFKKLYTQADNKELLDGQFPWGCALDSQENLYIAAKGGKGMLLMYSAAGVLSECVIEGVTPGGMNPMDVVVDKNDNIYLLLRGNTTVNGGNGKIYRIKEGKLVQTYDLAGKGLNESMLLNADGTKLFVFPQGTAPVNIHMIDTASGDITAIAGTGAKHANAGTYTDGTPGDPFSVTLNMCEGSVMMADGTIIFNDAPAGTIREFKPGPGGDYTKGTITTIAGKAYERKHADGLSTAARFAYPCGMSFASDGKTIYMLDGTGNSTVRKIYYK